MGRSMKEKIRGGRGGRGGRGVKEGGKEKSMYRARQRREKGAEVVTKVAETKRKRERK